MTDGGRGKGSERWGAVGGCGSEIRGRRGGAAWGLRTGDEGAEGGLALHGLGGDAREAVRLAKPGREGRLPTAGVMEGVGGASVRCAPGVCGLWGATSARPRGAGGGPRGGRGVGGCAASTAA